MNMKMMVTAYHLIEALASGLYESIGQRLMELIRNSLVASMKNPNRWEPKLVEIEVSLVDRHPLTDTSALIVLDHGRGLTDPGLDRYFNWLGTPLSQLRGNQIGSYGGASQKNIGRLAALALNEMCLKGEIIDRVKHGYYLFSRTAQSGLVRFVQVIPEKVELEGGIDTNRFITDTSTEMGPLKNIRGSFTAIVIPTPIFRNHGEIYEAIKLSLPREQDKMFKLQIGGKLVMPPPLENTVNMSSTDGRYRARIGKGNTGSDGIWLCDEQTGFRVASCLQLGRLLPNPLWYPDLAGDIFVPDLLGHQNTARSALNKEFTRKGNKAWQRLLKFLTDEVAPAALSLIDQDDDIKGAAAATVDELAEMFHDIYGTPDDDEFEKIRIVRPKPTPDDNVIKITDTEKKDPDKTDKTDERKRRHILIRVRDEVYTLYRGLSIHEYIFAQLKSPDSKIIFVNVRGGYKSLPPTKSERREHCLMQILTVIAENQFPGDTYLSKIRANELRSDFFGNRNEGVMATAAK